MFRRKFMQLLGCAPLAGLVGVDKPGIDTKYTKTVTGYHGGAGNHAVNHLGNINATLRVVVDDAVFKEFRQNVAMYHVKTTAWLEITGDKKAVEFIEGCAMLRSDRPVAIVREGDMIKSQDLEVMSEALDKAGDQGVDVDVFISVNEKPAVEWIVDAEMEPYGFTVEDPRPTP